MDPNVIGRIRVHGLSDLPACDIRIIAVLDLTPESHGNAVGIGLADVTTRRLAYEIDFEATYVNCFTAGICSIQRGFLPPVAPTDEAAILTALRVCGQPDPQKARVVRIKDTLSLGEIDVSASLLQAVHDHPNLSVIGPQFSLAFDQEKRLISPHPTPEFNRSRQVCAAAIVSQFSWMIFQIAHIAIRMGWLF
jgi:hypothetical protein